MEAIEILVTSEEGNVVVINQSHLATKLGGRTEKHAVMTVGNFRFEIRAKEMKSLRSSRGSRKSLDGSENCLPL